MPTPRQGYHTRDRIKRPSVTQILGRFKDSGGLIKWAYKQGREHENLSMRIETRGRLLKIEPQFESTHFADTFTDIAGELLGNDWRVPMPDAPAHLYDNVAKAALAGTIAHDLIDTHIRSGGNNEEVIKTGLQYQAEEEGVKLKAWNSYQQFKKWLANSRMKIEAHERPLVSEKYGFGGTPDATGIEAALIEGDVGTYTLVDWKTSNAVYGDYLIQLAAYAILIEEVEGKVINSAHLLRVAKESADFAHHYYGDLTVEKQAFLKMLELYGMVYAIERRA